MSFAREVLREMRDTFTSPGLAVSWLILLAYATGLFTRGWDWWWWVLMPVASDVVGTALYVARTRGKR